MRFREILAARPFALVEIRHRIESEAVDPMLSQKSSTLSDRSCTAGLSKFKSG